MNPKANKLKDEIARLRNELADREASLPKHSVRAHQIQAIEELEEEIDLKEKELKLLLGNS